MAIKIGGAEMTSDRTCHSARPCGGGWAVTWLPSRTLDRKGAITAMTLAEVATSRVGELAPDSALWCHVDNWAAELGLTGPRAVALASVPAEDRAAWGLAE